MSSPSFKYLLYDPQAKRFTRREALKLLEEYKRLGRDLPLLMDLSVRSSGYVKKVMANLLRHPDLLGPVISALQRVQGGQRLQDQPRDERADRYFAERSKYGGTGSIRAVSGGLPSLGKRGK